MSFILEALKKSEKTRQQTNVPNLSTRHNSAVKPTHKRSLWPGLLLALLIINAVILLWLFGPWTPLSGNKQATKITTAIPETNTIRTEMVNTAPVAQQTNTPPITQIPTTPQPTATVPEHITVPTNKPLTQQQSPTLSVNELPTHIQQQLPQLHMSVHAYTGDSNSLIRLNNNIMHQGNTLDGRYLLEQITADGAILSYQGYQFEILRKR